MIVEHKQKKKEDIKDMQFNIKTEKFSDQV